jgi:hypothetical protein
MLSRRSLGDCFDRYIEWLATTRRYRERSKREYLDDVSDLVEWLDCNCFVERAVRDSQGDPGATRHRDGRPGDAEHRRRRDHAYIPPRQHCRGELRAAMPDLRDGADE